MDTRLLQIVGGAALVGIAGCSPSDSKQSALARTGNIDRAAPIVAYQSISIDAPASVIWNLITQIGRWPEWQPSIKATKFNGPIAAGQPFEWNNDGTKISSKIEAVRPLDMIVWTGSAMGL
jgi:uncharacterized membrane protein